MYEKDLTPKQPMFEQTVTAFDLNGLFQLLTNLPDFHGTIIFTPSVSLGTSCARASGEPGSLVLSQAEAKRDNGSPIIAEAENAVKSTKPDDLSAQALEPYVKAGLLDDNLMPSSKLSSGEKAVVAHDIAERLKMRNFWLLFEQKWGVRYLRTAYTRFVKTEKFIHLQRILNSINCEG